MSLRRALAALPDDRETALAAREIIAFLSEHSDEALTDSRVVRATGIPEPRVREILDIFCRTFVVDCLGDPPEQTYRMSSSPVLALEVRRFVRSGAGSEARLKRGTEKFRGRYGTNR